MSLLVLSSLYLGFNSTATAQGTIDADVEAGDTYFYTLTKFPSFQHLLDLTGVSDEFDANNSLSVTGGLEGSQIYVKVLDKNHENMSYWDGTSQMVGDMPTVDIATGIILGQAITVNATIEGTSVVETVPAGMGLPIPFIFSTSTMFNVSMQNADPFLPIPLVLNNDFDLHELIFTQLASQVPSGSLTVLNDASQFKVSLVDVEVDENASLVLDGFVSYKKPSGIAQEVNLMLTNSTTAEVLIDIDMDLTREEYRPLDINVGDKFELTITDAGLDATTFGFPEDEDPQGLINEINANATAEIGETLISFEVVEVDGLYYSISGNLTAGEEFETFPENDGLRNDIWMVGFGRIGPGMLIPTEDPARTFETYWDEDLGDDVVTDQVVPVRQRALPGPFMTPDDDIYASWDATLLAGVERFDEVIDLALSLLESETDNIILASSATDDPIITPSFSSLTDANGYAGWTLGLDVDFALWENDTQVYDDGFGGQIVDQRFYWTNITGSASVSLKYSDGKMTELSLTASGQVDRYEYNDTHVNFDGGITLTELKVVITGTYTPAVVETTETSDTSITDTSDTTDTSTDSTTGTDTSNETPALPVPGFEIALTFLSMLGFAFVVRRRKL
jgi:hypothetical protein